MKKYLSLIILVFVLALALTSCSAEDDGLVVWTLKDNNEILTDGTDTYTRYGDLGIFTDEGNGEGFYFYSNYVTVENEYTSYWAEVIRKNMDSSIIFLSNPEYGLTAYIKTEDDKAVLNDFLHGDPELIRLTDSDGTSRATITKEFRDKLDSLSKDALSVPVESLKNTYYYQIMYFDKDDMLSRVHGRIYKYNGTYCYVNHEALDNSYFFADGTFAYTRGSVDLYPLDEEAVALLNSAQGSMEYYFPYMEFADGAIYDDSSDGILSKGLAITVILLTNASLGIILPLFPLAGSVFITVRNAVKKRRQDACAYIILAASVIWIIAGIIALILSL